MMYITGISFGMVFGIIPVDNNFNKTSYSLIAAGTFVDDNYNEKSFNLLFAGGFISIVAWVCSIQIKLRN